MLKTVLVNKTRLPIPVPIRDLQELLGWLEEFMLDQGQVITKIAVDEVTIDKSDYSACELDQESAVAVWVDSPLELAQQSVDALASLVALMIKDIKRLAVQLWQAEDRLEFVGDLLADLDLVTQLVEHCEVMLPDTRAVTGVRSHAFRVATLLGPINEAVAEEHWRKLARILLNRLEPVLHDLSAEINALQKDLLEIQVAKLATSS